MTCYVLVNLESLRNQGLFLYAELPNENHGRKAVVVYSNKNPGQRLTLSGGPLAFRVPKDGSFEMLLEASVGGARWLPFPWSRQALGRGYQRIRMASSEEDTKIVKNSVLPLYQLLKN